MNNILLYNNMKLLICISIIILIITLYFIIGFTKKRYYNYYPTLYLYPNNETDVKIVEKYNNERLNNKNIDNFVKLTDKSISHAFLNEIDGITIEEIHEYQNDIIYIIFFFKNLFNRPRPWQINPKLNHYKTKTAFSPSFPSGHSAQSQYIAKRLSQKYPSKRDKLYEVAEKCGLARVHGGLHFLSDHKFAKFLVSIIP